MPSLYVMKEMPDVKGTGERIMYPQMVMMGQTSTRELAEYIAQRSAFSVGVTEGVLCEVAAAMAGELAQGFSVKLDGIGTFSPALALRKDKEREEAEEDPTVQAEGSPHRNARSIVVGHINFKTDKELTWSTNKRCLLRRASEKPARSSQKYTAEQRLKIALDYLNEHPYLTVRDYRQLTGLLQASATRELRQWAETPGSGIGRQGQGSHRVYIKV